MICKPETSLSLSLSRVPWRSPLTIKAAFSLSSLCALALATAGLVAFVSVSPREANPDAVEAPARAQSVNPFGALVHVPVETLAAPAQVARSPLLEIDPHLTQPDIPAAGEPNDLAEQPAVAEHPMPPRRPQFAQDGAVDPGQRRTRAPQPRDVAIVPPQDNRGVIERFFNINPPQTPALAYARPDDGGLRDAMRRSSQMPMGAADGQTAVYDISARAVFMPNGEKLEAHSGLGELMDDPRRVHVKNKGATPPNVYELSPREALFHGVPALRMTPVGGANMYGRDGILAHNYLLGPNGDSNGCVSFKDYDRFLQAYHKGEVRRLIVVASRS